MKINIDPVIASRIKVAWSKLAPQQRQALAPQMLAANQQAVQVAQTGKAPSKAAPHHLMLAQSALSGDSDAVVGNLEAGVVVTVGPDGVIWGTGKWEQLDPGWAEAFAVYLETLLAGKAPFVNTPQTITIPDQVTIGIAGDWGTGDWRTKANPAASTDVGRQLATLNTEITIHLGDVYYAGTADQELHSLSMIWPQGSLGSFTLNSNHEMYSGAGPYFKAIGQPPFQKQTGCSYFALQNANWLILGLDSAYCSEESGLFMEGLLYPEGKPNEQSTFLQQQAAAAATAGKRIILLTHHNGLDDSGTTPNKLFEQVTTAFGGGGPVFWYWGHAHAAAVYKAAGPAGTLCRCCGHGALPWGHTSDLANSPNVVWYENRPANDPDMPERVFNGFATLKLDGQAIQETFYDENGGVAWKLP
jgi:hypothetical protein